MSKEMLSAQATKNEFVKSIHHWLDLTFQRNGTPEYIKNFNIEGSSIMCELPPNFFNLYDIPANTKIEMKFIVKKS